MKVKLVTGLSDSVTKLILAIQYAEDPNTTQEELPKMNHAKREWHLILFPESPGKTGLLLICNGYYHCPKKAILSTHIRIAVRIKMVKDFFEGLSTLGTKSKNIY
jgi:hypothetical protein